MKKALVVGIDDYSVRPLDGCVNDADALEEIFASVECGFLVKKLTNGNATRAAVSRDIQWALRDAEFSIFYFAGHGTQTDVTTYLATADTADGEEGVDVDWIQKAVARIAAEDQTVLILLDCCHSGASPLTAAENTYAIAPTDLPALRGRGRILIAACNSEQDADETISPDGTPHGKFTFYLLNALKGHAANENGIVSLSAAYDYIAWNFDGQKEQVPVFRGDQEGVVVLAKNVTPIGTWRPAKSSDLLTRDKAVTLGGELLTRTLSALQTSAIADWQAQGYRVACQTFEPIRKWFIRVGQQQPDLLADKEFFQLYKTCEQYGRQLGTLSPGTKLAEGTVENSLGAGTFGTVFRIVDAAQNTKCLKLYHANDLHDMSKVGRFRRGYEAMRQMDHPNIVKVRDFTEVPLGFFMDYIDGPNARQYLPGITKDPAQVIKLLLQVAETIQHSHTREVIHRDVKPENILIQINDDGDARAFLTDFDLAWFSTATKVTKIAEGFGSQFYAAPEQMAKPNSPSARSEKVDVYSFGQLCFFFLTGRDPTPLSHEENVRVLTHELGGNWIDPEEAMKLVDFYSKATQMNPSLRPSSFRDICQLLAGVQLALDSIDDALDAAFFLNCLRLTVSGVLNEQTSPVAISMRSRSGRTELTALVIKEDIKKLGIDVSFRPDDIYVEGMKSHDARLIVNQRVDNCLSPFQQENGVRREGAKGGGFETTVRIENLAKDRSGVLRAREIVCKVIDVLEQH